ncbi:MAG: PDZ domain (Also known as DHR or GLGF) [candidate division BRC1 bacterium ADurb.BinA292]|nr:MAG: PDZ domain (Also known as DHR or GLGF) [candidate division BRC1 bacterium ADurb.BinA292]
MNGSLLARASRAVRLLALLGLACLARPCLAQPAAAASADAAPTTGPLTLQQAESFLEHFAVIEVFFKRSEEDKDAVHPEYESYISRKLPMRLIGIALDAEHVVTIDTDLDEKWIDRIQVTDMRGRSAPAERAALLLDAPALVFRIADPTGLTLRPPQFTDPGPAAPDGLQQLVVTRHGSNYMLQLSPAQPLVQLTPEYQLQRVLSTAVYDPDASSRGMMDDWSGWSSDFEINKVPVLLLDQRRRPVGLAFRAYLPYGESAEEGLRPDQRERVAWTQYAAAQDQLTTAAGRWVMETHITFRQKAEEGGGTFLGLPLPNVDSIMGGQVNVPDEWYVYGFPIAPDLLFVPTRIQREFAKVIDRIEVRDGDRTIPGRFYGAYEDIAAFLIRLDEPLSVAPAEIFSSQPVRMIRPMLSIYPERRYGREYLDVGYARLLSRLNGYRDVLEFVPAYEARVGALYTDLDGNLQGVTLEQRKEDEDKERFRRAGGFPYFGGGETFYRFYSIPELAPYFNAPNDHLDPTIVSLSEEEEERKMWLGVEFDPMTQELAKTLDVQPQTKDGTIGLWVTRVYPGSPAARLGLERGSILLELREEGEAQPVELKAADTSMYDFDFSDVELPEGMENLGISLPRAKPWKNRRNMLTRLLEVIGEGRTVHLRYLDPQRAEHSVTFAVEKAPHDFASAPKYKDEEIGLTVKELTYEVREALMLPPDARHLVVSSVEEGSPAAVARVELYDLIIAINDQPVPDLETFKRIAQDARAEREASGRATLRVTLQQLDKTRIVDLTLE